LNSFYATEVPRAKRLPHRNVALADVTAKRNNLPKCGGHPVAPAKVTERFLACPSDKKVIADKAFALDIYDSTGDFGVAALLAHAWAEVVQREQGAKRENDQSQLQADCYTGAWAQAVFAQELGSQVSLSPGDLDEVVQALIADEAAHKGADASDRTFARMQAFRRGFFEDFDACSPRTPGRYS
jgi:predicted metalloprotease